MAFLQRFIALLISVEALKLYSIIGIVLILIFGAHLYLHTSNSSKRRLLSYRISFVGLFVSFIGFLLALAGIFVPVPTIIRPSLPIFDPIELSDVHPLALVFDRPIGGGIEATISPPLEGVWEYAASGYGPWFKDVYRFVPSTYALPDTEYTITLNNILPFMWASSSQARDTLFVVQTASLPEVIETTPSSGQQAFRLDQPIEIILDKPAPEYLDWEIEISPAVSFDITWGEDRNVMILQPHEPLRYDTEYTVAIYRSLETQLDDADVLGSEQTLVTELTFRTVASATVKDISFRDAPALPEQPLVVEFAWPMNTAAVEEALSIDPAIAFDTSWSDAVLTLTPQTPWMLDSTYTLTIGTSAVTLDGGGFEDSYVYTFDTVGPAQVLSFEPRHDSVNVDVSSPFSMHFDQPMNQESVEMRLAIQPHVPSDYRWEGSTLIIDPRQSLNFDSVYQINLAAGAYGTYGMPMRENYISAFRTQSNVFALEVPLYKQHYMFTCFTSAARMALSYKGVEISELGFLDEIGYDTTQRNFVTNTWGNPNSGVVGHYNGAGAGGYGAHWEPVAKAMGAYVETEVKRQWNIQELLAEVKEGNPVMVWWVNGVWPAKDVSWNLPSGERVYTVNGMHVEVVRGWVGSQSDPDYILTNDPWRGQRRYTPEAFYDLWRWFDNTAVVLR